MVSRREEAALKDRENRLMAALHLDERATARAVELCGFFFSASTVCVSHTIHGTNGIFTYIWLVDFLWVFIVGKYAVRPMDPMGKYM